MIYITYYRVSTKKQGADGLGMDAQRSMLARYSSEIVAEYIEVESGKRSDNRPQLIAALAHAKKIGATLLIAKLDRLARNVFFVSGLMESGVEFIAADMPTANKLTIHVMAAFAEHEAREISSRTKAGLAQARCRGVKLGGARPVCRPCAATGVTYCSCRAEAISAATSARTLAARTYAEQLAPAIRYVESLGRTSLRAIADELNKIGHKAPRGGAWTAAQVMRVKGAI
jgi:DNA invertase Pin-like site-specific DNA recombinase